eukprot:4848685-Prymnesium_polylepis.1
MMQQHYNLLRVCAPCLSILIDIKRPSRCAATPSRGRSSRAVRARAQLSKKGLLVPTGLRLSTWWDFTSPRLAVMMLSRAPSGDHVLTGVVRGVDG